MADLTGKVALVTGASRGIGKAIAVRLAHDGADVVVTYASSAGATDAVVAEIKAMGRKASAVQVNAADAAALRAVVQGVAKDFGRLDILVNNAGAFLHKPLTEITDEEIDHLLHLNVRSVVVASQEAARLMPQGGRIINIGSVNRDRTAFPGISLYGMSKSALTGFTKGASRDLAERGITINTIEPGPTDTDMNPASGPMAEMMHSVMAMKRHGKPEEVASMVAYLASEEAAFVTGSNIPVDGGFMA